MQIIKRTFLSLIQICLGLLCFFTMFSGIIYFSASNNILKEYIIFSLIPIALSVIFSYFYRFKFYFYTTVFHLICFVLGGFILLFAFFSILIQNNVSILNYAILLIYFVLYVLDMKFNFDALLKVT